MTEEITRTWVRHRLPPRPAQSHKGTFGTVAAICGSEDYPGAAVLACHAAYRAGAGKVILYAPAPVRSLVLSSLPETVCRPIEELLSDGGFSGFSGKMAILCGCGMGRTERTKEIVTRLFASGVDVPILLDADALNVLSDEPTLVSTRLSAVSSRVVCTPHPLEFSRLFGGDVPTDPDDRLARAADASARSHAVILLKGHGSVIATPDGDCFVCPTGTSALAKAGSGDVLAGLVAGFLAQGVSPADAAAIGAWVHGRAGEMLARDRSEYGVLPSELPLACARVIADLTC